MRYFIASIPFAMSAFAAPSLVPKSTSELCGPSSNCEVIYNEDGTTDYRFKQGFEPGTPDYAERFQTRDLDPQKRDAEITTKVTIGKTKIEWGCDETINVYFDGVKELCGESGCDEGSRFTKETQWVGPGNFMNSPQSRTLKLKAKGSYFKQEVRDIYIEALKTTTTTETVQTEDRKWCKPRNGFAGGCSEVGWCPMKIFPNFIKITRFDGENVRDWLDIKLEIDQDGGECLTEKLLGSIAGAINPVAGGFFGVASAFCESSSD